jgi:hypothetical protein
MASTTGPGPAICTACRGPLGSIGIEQFRVGGTTGGWKLLFGEWAELGEDMLALEVLACTVCRRVEFRVPSR